MERCIFLTGKQGLCCRDGRRLMDASIILLPMKKFRSRPGSGKCLGTAVWGNGLGYRSYGSLYVNERTPDGERVNEVGIKVMLIK